MNPGDYRKILADNPWFESKLRFDDDARLARWLKKLSFIHFHPSKRFEALDHRARLYGNDNLSMLIKNIRYAIYFHADDERFAQRCRIADFRNHNPTVKEIITEVFRKKGEREKIVFDAMVKIMDCTDSDSSYTESMEIFTAADRLPAKRPTIFLD